MAITACKLFALGTSNGSVVNAGNQNQGHSADSADRTVPDLLVYVEDGNLVTDSVVFVPKPLRPGCSAESVCGCNGRTTAQPTAQPPTTEGASAGRGTKPSQEVVVRMAPWKAAFGSREAFGAALPYARDGVRVTVFYDEIQEGTRGRPRFESVMLAHVLVHEIIQVLSTASDLEFAGVSADVYSSVDAERS